MKTCVCNLRGRSTDVDVVKSFNVQNGQMHEPNVDSNEDNETKKTSRRPGTTSQQTVAQLLCH